MYIERNTNKLIYKKNAAQGFPKGLQTWYNNGSGHMQKWQRATLKKSLNANNFYFYADWKISNNICRFVTIEKSKMACPFNGNESSRLSYLTGLLTKLPGEHIPLL